MDTDYKSIADASAGYPDYLSAFDALTSQTVIKHREMSGNELRIWAAQYSADYQALKSAAASSTVAEIAVQLIGTPDSLLSLDDSRVVAMLDGLTPAVISNEGRAALLSMAEVTEPVWPSIGREHVKKALRLRAEGKV